MATRVRLRAAGFDQPLAVESFDPPEPGPGQVLLQVEACAVCHRDLIDRAGRFPWMQLPVTPGHEAAGTVLAVGPGVVGFAPGDRAGTLHRDACGTCEACRAGQTSLCPAAVHVFGLIADGGYATHLVAPESALYPLPATLPADHACLLHCTAGTAWRGLVRAGGLQDGQRAVIVGANGGVGSAAIQVARRLGAHVTAVVRREEHAAHCVAQGAHHVVVDPSDGFHKRMTGPVDVALDCVGSPTIHATVRTLKLGGRAVAVGNVSETRASLNLGQLIVFGVSLHGSSGANREDMRALLALHDRHPLDLEALIDRRLPLDQAEAAQQAVRAGGLRGRIVLAMQA